MQKKEALEMIEQNYKKLIVLENVKVSPQLAAELLNRNTSNRSVKTKVVANYVSQMKEGKWKFSGETLKISKTGSLLDGQHRLYAIIESDTCQTYNIQLGLEDDAFDVMDIGKPRSAGDTLFVDGYKHPTTMSFAIKLVHKYDKARLEEYKNKQLRSDRLSNTEVRMWLENNKEALMVRCAERAHKYNRNSNFLSAGTYCAFEYIFSRKDEQEATDFMNMLSTGENTSSTKNTSIFLLRQKLINMKGDAVDITFKHAIIIKAWNLYREKKKISRLNWKYEDGFPKAI